MALQWREPQNTIKPAKTLGEILIQLALNYASPKIYIDMKKDVQYKQCVRCVLDNIGDEHFSINNDGVCSYYEDAQSEYSQFVYEEKDVEHNLNNLANKIKKAGKGKEYDCIIGLSGGVDSSYVALLAKKLGLRPLAVHFDNGWNSEIAVSNVKSIVQNLDIDLFTYVVNWEEFVDLQRSFFKASVVDVEMLTDNSHKAICLNIGKQHNIKYHLTGGNFRTENMMPTGWNWNKQDVRNIKSIHRQFGSVKIKSYKSIGLLKWKLIEKLGMGAKFERILDLVNYRKIDVMEDLKKIGWKYYGGKHYESVFTKFYQAYYLPKKFKIDKRKVHLSSLILNNEITRDQALIELKQPLYKDNELEEEKSYVLKKLGFSKSEFDLILNDPPRRHDYYPSNVAIYKSITSIWQKLNKLK